MFHIRCIYDEGTNSPFVRRMMLNIHQIRDAALPKSNHVDFDEKYDKVYTALAECRQHVILAYNILADHIDQLTQGNVVVIQNASFIVNTTIDHNLRMHFNGFVNSGNRAYKDMQELTRSLGLDIHCLYGKMDDFNKWIKLLDDNNEKPLSTFMKCVRVNWANEFVKLRNEIEHASWQLPEMQYTAFQNRVVLEPPYVYGMDCFEYMKYVFCQLAVFVENVTIFALHLQNTDMCLEVNGIPWTIQYCKIADESLLIKNLSIQNS